MRAPRSPLSTPEYKILPKGETLHRVHPTGRQASSFNPCQGRPTRFAPIKSDSGNCVPSLYAGSTLRAAIHETIFHDIPANAEMKTVPLQEVVQRSHSELKTTRSLKLVELRNVNLNAWKITRRELISSNPTQYQSTAKWAEVIHHQFPDTDGLVWTSNQCDPDDAYVFFGDRVAAGDFSVARSRKGGTEESFREDVVAEGKRRGITITF